jgi:hypothetical protein
MWEDSTVSPGIDPCHCESVDWNCCRSGRNVTTHVLVWGCNGLEYGLGMWRLMEENSYLDLNPVSYTSDCRTMSWHLQGIRHGNGENYITRASKIFLFTQYFYFVTSRLPHSLRLYSVGERWVSVEHWWSDNWRRPEHEDINLHHCLFVHHNIVNRVKLWRYR